MQTPIAIFLGLALIAGAIYNKASISCTARDECAVLFNGEVTFIGTNQLRVVDIESRSDQRKELKKLDSVAKPE